MVLFYNYGESGCSDSVNIWGSFKYQLCCSLFQKKKNKNKNTHNVTLMMYLKLETLDKIKVSMEVLKCRKNGTPRNCWCVVKFHHYWVLFYNFCCVDSGVVLFFNPTPFRSITSLLLLQPEIWESKWNIIHTVVLLNLCLFLYISLLYNISLTLIWLLCLLS